MEIVRSVATMQEQAEQLRLAGKRVCVVPTMGALHEGHASLIKLARHNSDVVITTLFVNPAQFGPQEDYTKYPRDFARDEEKAREAGTDLLFSPEAGEMYPEHFLTYVETDGVSKVLEGKFRPTHFRGVTTVVAKLFNITKPHCACFGQKDAQQVFVIRRMIRDLNMDVEMIVGPIVRESDGLAKSSRNIYLSAAERQSAVALSRSLGRAAELIAEGERDSVLVRDAMHEILNQAAPAQTDYVAIIDPETFREVETVIPPTVLVALAVRFGTTRLIDNILVPVQGHPAP